MKFFVDIFGSYYKIGPVLTVMSMHIRFFFLRSWYRMGIFYGLLKFQIFFGGAWYS